MAFLTSGEAATLQKELAELTQLQAFGFQSIFPRVLQVEVGNLRVVILSVPWESLDPPTEGFEPKLWGCIGALKIQGELTVWLVVDYLGEFFFDNVEAWHHDEDSRRERCGWQKWIPSREETILVWDLFFPRWWWFSAGIFLKIKD